MKKKIFLVLPLVLLSELAAALPRVIATPRYLVHGGALFYEGSAGNGQRSVFFVPPRQTRLQRLLTGTTASGEEVNVWRVHFVLDISQNDALQREARRRVPAWTDLKMLRAPLSTEGCRLTPISDAMRVTQAPSPNPSDILSDVVCAAEFKTKGREAADKIVALAADNRLLASGIPAITLRRSITGALDLVKAMRRLEPVRNKLQTVNDALSRFMTAFAMAEDLADFGIAYLDETALTHAHEQARKALFAGDGQTMGLRPTPAVNSIAMQAVAEEIVFQP